MFIRGLQGHEQALGNDNESTAAAAYNLATFYTFQDKMESAEKAESIYLQAIEGFERSLPPDDERSLNVVNNLGALYFSQGRRQEAENTYLRALEGFEKTLQLVWARRGTQLRNLTIWLPRLMSPAEGQLPTCNRQQKKIEHCLGCVPVTA